MNRIVRTTLIAAAVAGAALGLSACGTNSAATVTDPPSSARVTAPATSTPAPAPKPAATAAPAQAREITEPGTYVAGRDIPAGIWAPAHFTSIDDVKSVAVNGVPAKLYQPIDTDSATMHVTFRTPAATTGAAGDGYQRSDGSWDYAVELPPGQSVTISAPLAVPFAQYSDMNGRPVNG